MAPDNPDAVGVTHDGELARLVWKHFEEDITEALAEVQEALSHQCRIPSRRVSR